MMHLLAPFAATMLIAVGIGPAEAHPGHISDGGHGHNHWLAAIILGGVGTLAAGAIIYRAVTGRLPLVDARPQKR